jgi:hypothetical protein
MDHHNTAGASVHHDDAGGFVPPSQHRLVEYSLFAGDLSPDVSDEILAATFRHRYPSVSSAKVICDPVTGRPKGFGFVRFGDQHERDDALLTMSGTPCGSTGRLMRVSLAQPRRGPGQPFYEALGSPTARHAPHGWHSPSPGGAPTSPSSASAYAAASTSGSIASAVVDGSTDPNNTTVFVGGLDPWVTEDLLRDAFSCFGDLVYVKIPPGKNCGFVQFVLRECAERAIAQGHGMILGRQAVRLSWGRSNQARSGGVTATPAAYAAMAGGGAFMMPPGLIYANPHLVGMPPRGSPPFYGYPDVAGRAYDQNAYIAHLAAGHYAQLAAVAGSPMTLSSPGSAMGGPGIMYGGADLSGMAWPISLPMPPQAATMMPAAADGVVEATEALRSMFLAQQRGPAERQHPIAPETGGSPSAQPRS